MINSEEMRRLYNVLDMLHIPRLLQYYIVRYVSTAEMLPDLERNLEDIKKEDPNT